MCAVTWTDDGRTYHDTIIGQFVFQGGTVVDTLPGTGKWNIMAENADALMIEACSLRPDTSDGEVRVEVAGYVDAEAAPGCARVDVAFHQ